MQPAAPAVRDLVLVGAGHSHVQVLRRFGMRPEPGIRLTVIAREVHTPYSGMLPGHVAGRYGRDQMHIDVARLARFADARLIPSEVTSLDLDGQRVLMGDRPPLRYDILSLNTGGVPGEGYAQRSYVTPVKPIGRFLPRWNAVCEELARRPKRLVLVGGGPGSVELALAMRARFPETARCTLVTADPELLVEHARAVRRRLTALLSAREVGVHTDFFAEAVEEDRVRARDGRVLPHDHVFWVTGVEPFAAFRDSGLATDPDGFVEVNDTLQSTSHPDVFAAGDAAGMPGSPRPKSGVFAVRQGPALADNLRRHALGRPPRRYRAQRQALALIGTADGRAVASRGPWHASGRWVWVWKDWIDRRFMRRFQDLPEMETPAPALAPALGVDAPDAMRCGGCGAKLGADLLERVLRRLPVRPDPDLVQGIGDDAAIVRLESSTLAMTCDGFRAMVDDPWRFGRIAAHHAMNDLFAMNALPRHALALVTVPVMADALMEEDLYQVMAGAVSVFHAHDVTLAGGHSAEGAELSVGFAVTGAAPGDVLTKGGMQPGQRLVLTKPIGTGALLAGAMQGRTSGRDLVATLDLMDASSAAAARILVEHGATACTDVTGFGLAGHLSEMTRASGAAARLQLCAIPMVPAAVALMEEGVQSSLQPNNAQALEDFVVRGCVPGDPRLRLLADPQTAGGLLAGVPAASADACVAALRAAGYADSAIIGDVMPEGLSVIEAGTAP